MRWILGGGVVGLVALLAGLILWIVRPGDTRKVYDADSPEALIDSAYAAVAAGDADALADLVYADSPEMRGALDRLGGLLGSLQGLARDVNERFPAEVAQMREEAAAGGGAGLGRLLGGVQRRGGGPPDPSIFRALLADPFAWTQGTRERVTTVAIAEDAAAVLVDGKPAFTVGLTLRRADGRWWIDLPLQNPLIARYAPKTVEEKQVLASLMLVFDNAVKDLSIEVREGKMGNIREVSNRAGELAFGPMMMAFIAYDRAMKARETGG